MYTNMSKHFEQICIHTPKLPRTGGATWPKTSSAGNQQRKVQKETQQTPYGYFNPRNVVHTILVHRFRGELTKTCDGKNLHTAQ